MKKQYRGTALLMVCVLLIPGFAMADDTEDRIAALEARIAALEEQVAQLLPEETPPPPPTDEFAVGEQLHLEQDISLTIKSYETGQRFRYYPAGGFFSSTLSAKSGYQLLCMFVRIENNSGTDVSTSKLLDANLYCGTDYSAKARDSLFYLTNRGVYAGGLKSIPPKSAVEGCMLFALPDEAISSPQRLSVQIVYDGVPYECVLREPASLLPGDDDAGIDF